MTHDEIHALPDVTTRLITSMRVIDGEVVNVPVWDREVGALFMREQDGVFQDASGARWVVGWSNGIRVRREY